MEIFTTSALAALFQVIAIDLVLAGDNAIVIGLAAAGLPTHQREKAILVGILTATVLRISFATVTAYLFGIVGLRLLGGMLLAWVCSKMWIELRSAEKTAELAATEKHPQEFKVRQKTFAQAATQIVVADVSMSLDNVLAIAGAAMEHPTILVTGLILSIALMGLAAKFVASLLQRYWWIAYIGLAVIVYVTLTMLYHGSLEVFSYLQTGIN